MLCAAVKEKKKTQYNIVVAVCVYVQCTYHRKSGGHRVSLLCARARASRRGTRRYCTRSRTTSGGMRREKKHYVIRRESPLCVCVTLQHAAADRRAGGACVYCRRHIFSNT